MILNIGFNKSVYKKDIIFIMDAKTVEMSNINKKFVSENIVKDYYIENKTIKTYIVTEENGITKVYPSYIKSIYLVNR